MESNNDNNISSKLVRDRTYCGLKVKVRYKLLKNFECLVLSLVIFLSLFGWVQCNRPPRFLIDGQTEIVLRLKEGKETPVGE